MIWELKSLCDKDVPTACINGKWVPSRSINYKYRSYQEKIKEVWLVWTGKVECFKWPEGQ